MSGADFQKHHGSPGFVRMNDAGAGFSFSDDDDLEVLGRNDQ